jgi:hypothetical protein
MNEQLKEDWLEALRSGEYTQCDGTLERPDGSNCCLGVLLDIMDAPWIHDEGEFRRYYETEDDLALVHAYEAECAEALEESFTKYCHVPHPGVWGEDSSLTESARAEAGLTVAELEYLVELNDDAGASFDEIADYIDAKL